MKKSETSRQQTTVERRRQFKKHVKIHKVWEQLGFDAVAQHFRDNKDLELVLWSVYDLRRFDATIKTELALLDASDVEPDYIDGLVHAELVRWGERISFMTRVLKDAHRAAWAEYERVNDAQKDFPA